MTKTTTAAAPTGPELTTRSIVVGLVVAVIIGSAYPYCVLKLGFGPGANDLYPGRCGPVDLGQEFCED